MQVRVQGSRGGGCRHRRVVRARVACAAELPRGPVTAATVASAQAEATSAAAASDRGRPRQGAVPPSRSTPPRPPPRPPPRRPQQTHVRRTSPPPPPPRPRRPTRSRTSTRRPPPPPRPRPTRPPPPTNAAREPASFAKLSTGTSTEARRRSRRHALPARQLPASDNVRLPRPRARPDRRQRRQDCPAFNPTKCPAFSALNFLHYENLGYDVMVANGTPGLGVWSLKDPAHPAYIAPITADLRSAWSAGRDPHPVLGGREHDGRQPSQDRLHVEGLGQEGHLIVDVKDPLHPAIIGFQPTSRATRRPA